MKLDSKFDVLRGWPREGALDETFPVVAGVKHVAGTIVALDAAGNAVAATTGDAALSNSQPVWIVVEGADDYSGDFVRKVVCLRGNCLVRTTLFDGAIALYSINTLVSFNAGKFKVAVATNQIVGEVVTKNATNGTIDVYYHGGSRQML